MDEDSPTRPVEASVRLTELRAVAAERARTMPVYDDPAAEAAERSQVTAAFERLQVETAAWQG